MKTHKTQIDSKAGVNSINALKVPAEVCDVYID
jgi:hypothetical protein